MSSIKYLELQKNLNLESGEVLSNPTIAYHTYGELNAEKNNVVWVCHALTSSSDVFSWWPGLFGEKDIFNPKEYFIVCANVLGSHYGTTCPLSINPNSGTPYYHSFPLFTIRDIVSLHKELANHLNIQNIDILIGGSMGGHQALEWAIQEPEKIQKLILLATSAVHTPWGVAFNASQRWAIENDVTWKENSPNAGLSGMEVARSIALLSYRNYYTYKKTQQPSDENLLFPDRAESYQHYQGQKLAKRFNAFSYWYLSKAMDSQNVGRNRGSLEQVLQSVKAQTLVLSLENDYLFTLEDQEFLHKNIPNSQFKLIESDYGHDGFLIENVSIAKAISQFLKNESTSQTKSVNS